MTISEARKEMINALKEIYSESESGNITDMILERFANFTKTELTSNRNFQLDDAQVNAINDSTKRLLQSEPVQYVINEAWFYGNKYYVDKNVLIPRPETEELVDWIIKSDKKFTTDFTVLDIGSGSGCIPISLKQKLPAATVLSCDISEAALKVAMKNANSIGVTVNFIQLNFLNEQERKQLPMVDVIVSNPPYVPENNKHAMHANVLNYEPHTALFVPDNDPLLFYTAITVFGQSHLKEHGAVFLEIHEEYGEDVKRLFENNRYTNVTIKEDMQGKQRMISARKA